MQPPRQCRKAGADDKTEEDELEGAEAVAEPDAEPRGESMYQADGGESSDRDAPN